MTQTTERPRFLNLLKIRLPLPGILSILHRISGVFMVLSIPFLIYLFDVSLASEDGFATATAVLDTIIIKISMAVIVWGLCHHLFAGIRFMLLDMDIGIERAQARMSSWIVFAVSVVAAMIILGVAW